MMAWDEIFCAYPRLPRHQPAKVVNNTSGKDAHLSTYPSSQISLNPADYPPNSHFGRQTAGPNGAGPDVRRLSIIPKHITYIFLQKS
jgi:hypothetical protein